MPHLHRLAGAVIICAVVVGALLSGGTVQKSVKTARAGSLSSSGPSRRPVGLPHGGPGHAADAARRWTPTLAPSATAPSTPAPAASAAVQAKANELGQVPVLMYHRVVTKPQSSLDRTPAQLKAELTRLANEGYVPVTAAEFAAGRIDIPAGRHPVVLTFDDASPGQFALDERGNPRADTAVGVLDEVAAAHPGFRPVATFYVNREPFVLGDKAQDGLRWLTGRGFEIGNHTYTHPSLSGLSEAAVRKEIDTDENQIVALTGAHATTFAYPYGALPAHSSWAKSHDGHYRFDAIFLAGWRPSESPFAKAFDRFEIPRIRSAGKIAENDCKRFCSTAWLDWLRAHPELRYTSDGDPRTITFPAAENHALAAEYRDQARSY